MAITDSHRDRAQTALEKALKELGSTVPGLSRGIVTSCIYEAVREVSLISELKRPRKAEKKGAPGGSTT